MLGYRVEPIENGYLVIIEQPEPAEWDKDAPQSSVVAGIPIEPTKTWFAKDEEEINRLLKYEYFARC